MIVPTLTAPSSVSNMQASEHVIWPVRDVPDRLQVPGLETPYPESPVAPRIAPSRALALS